MKYLLQIVLMFFLGLFMISCSDDNESNLKPPDFSPYIIGTWTGNTVFKDPNLTKPDTLYFVMTLDGIENNISGETDFTVSQQATEVLDITGAISYPSLSMDYLSDNRSFSFSGQFSATNSDIIMGTIQNQKYGSLPITFTKKK